MAAKLKHSDNNVITETTMTDVKNTLTHSVTWLMLTSVHHTGLKSHAHSGNCPREQELIGQNCLHLQVMKKHLQPW